MMIARFVAALIAPLLLWGCVLTPGKFVSTLTVNADRSFTFTYKGEVIALAPSAGMKELGGSAATQKVETDLDAGNETRNRAIAAALAREAGYRSAVYRGKGKFDIDYAISGTLSHGFVFPFNADAEVMLPFLMVELRQGGTVRVKAPGFAVRQEGGGASALGGMGSGGATDAAKFLDGIFTLDTDAEIVSQNTEEGAKSAGARKQIIWRATPLTRDAPVAVLRLAR
jgi:hypothetical protein